ncbi:MAG: NYN domain-containing protein [Patescibacteria group bacterium]|nr:NYN domain-containing protein [Patescibacteria group bacterium]
MDKINWQQYGRVAVFIDVANVIYSLKKLKWKIDYKKLQKYFIKETKLVDIYFYYSTKKENSGQANLLEMLARKGFQLKIKEVKIIKLKNGKILLKGNCDIEVAIDMIDLMPAYDTAILLSGDSDFAPLIKYVQKHGKKVVAVSTRGHVSKEIIQSANKFMWFNWFKDFWNLL